VVVLHHQNTGPHIHIIAWPYRSLPRNCELGGVEQSGAVQVPSATLAP
jgi:hypothetical protein